MTGKEVEKMNFLLDLDAGNEQKWRQGKPKDRREWCHSTSGGVIEILLDCHYDLDGFTT